MMREIARFYLFPFYKICAQWRCWQGKEDQLGENFLDSEIEANYSILINKKKHIFNNIQTFYANFKINFII